MLSRQISAEKSMFSSCFSLIFNSIDESKFLTNRGNLLHNKRREIVPMRPEVTLGNFKMSPFLELINSQLFECKIRSKNSEFTLLRELKISITSAQISL